ncbi:MAG: hypothetical protein Aurels2KO_55830 [Aureliella sp.]
MPREEILLATVQQTDEQIQQSADKLTTPQLEAVESFVSENLQLVGVERVLAMGCLLGLWAKASKEAENPEPFKRMCERLGIRRALGYEYRRIWDQFGKRLVQHPRLAKFIVAEALKRLARESTPEEAVEEAFALAAQEQFVSINVANELKAKYTQPAEVEPTASDRAAEQQITPNATVPTQDVKPARSLVGSAWEFTGRVLRIVASAKDVDAIIEDLKQAIEDLERERNVNARIASFYSVGEENHA